MSNPNFLFLPAPRDISYQDDVFSLSDGKLIALNGTDVQALRFSATSLQQALQHHAGVEWGIVAGTAYPTSQVGATLSVVPQATHHPQGYNLTITPQAIHLVASEPVGVFYGVLTLIQLLEQCDGEIPTLRISDSPDFPHRGVMLDISRDKVPTMETLYALVDLLASWKINQFQLYTEHTFAYQQHPEVWADASPMTGEEILALDAYCKARFIELVPNQNTFGHMERWLQHERYLPLAEAPDGSMTPWEVYHHGPFSLAPTDSASLDLIRSLFDELLPHFSSTQLNIGCDETFDIGQGRSKQTVEELGAGRVYLDFLLNLYRETKRRGRTMQFWGDIITQHPDLVPELPHDSIALEWGYEFDHPFDEHGALFANSGIPFYVCPGTSSWNCVAGRTQNALDNLRNAAQNGLKHGAIGYLITDWGDRGHWQPLPISYLGYAYGAALSWCQDSNQDLDLPSALSRYVFQDATNTIGQLLYDLGNIYQQPGKRIHNSSLYFWLLQLHPSRSYELNTFIASEHLPSAEHLQQTKTHISELIATLPDSAAPLLQRELTWVADMLQHACDRGLWLLNSPQSEENSHTRQQLTQDATHLIAEYNVIWHARNRPGGFRESVERMEKMRGDYGV